MVYIFYQAINDYAVEEFIDCAQIELLSTDRLRDMISFLVHIHTKDREENLSDKNEIIFKEILNFTDSLKEFPSFSKSTCTRPENFPWDYLLPIIKNFGKM